MLRNIRFDSLLSPANALKVLGHVGFLLFLFFTLYFFKERSLYTDSAYVLLRMINTESVGVENARYASLLPQLLTVAAIKLHLPLKWVMLIFSASYPVFFYSLFLLCTYFFKNTESGISILFLFFLCIRNSFFHTVTETYQGLAWCSVLYAFLFQSRFMVKQLKTNWTIFYYASLCTIILLCFYSHPVTLFPILFILTLYSFHRKLFFQLQTLLPLLLVVILFLLKFLTTSANSYEGSFFSSFGGDIWFKLINSYCIDYLKQHKPQYTILMALTLGTFIWLLIRSKILDALLFGAYTIAFLLITLISYHKGDADIMMERGIVPFVLIASILFFREFLQCQKMFLLILPCLTLLYCSNHIYGAGWILKKRNLYLNHLLAQVRPHGQKILLTSDQLEPDRIIVPWAISAETLLLSTLQDARNPVTIHFIKDAADPGFDYTREDLFLAVDFWREWSYRDLNAFYFRFKPGPYKVGRVY